MPSLFSSEGCGLKRIQLGSVSGRTNQPESTAPRLRGRPSSRGCVGEEVQNFRWFSAEKLPAAFEFKFDYVGGPKVTEGLLLFAGKRWRMAVRAQATVVRGSAAASWRG